MSEFHSISDLGWQPFFQQQLSLDEWSDTIPARVIEQQKSQIAVATESGVFTLALLPSMPVIVVGDWLLLDEQKRFIRLLARKTSFERKAAGSKVDKQIISANVDVAFIVCSMNDDFNLNRIERYLSLVSESGAEPVVLLSKCDLAASPEDLLMQVQALDPYLAVAAINCLDAGVKEQLSEWIRQGATVAVLGSSGVGKSTLVNTLLGVELQSTGEIRKDDSKGRHTTTQRALISLGEKGMILDTPGMREIQLADCREGIAATFSDIEEMAQHCKFGDCQHESEPGCAVRQAIEEQELDERRLSNYRKLLREESFNSASLSERRSSDKALGKFYKKTLTESKKLKGR